MKSELNRRAFIADCMKAGALCCAMPYCSSNVAQDPLKNQDAKPDPKKLEYCGYKCPAGCTLKKGTLENNIELKKKAYAEFRFREKYGIDFNPETVFCYGCKSSGDKPVSLPVNACTVRKCVIDKGYESCIQCDGLAKCEKELWSSLPKFRETVIEMQKKYKG